MTLLLNHQQLLNGSKFFICFLIIIQNLIAQSKLEFEKGIKSFNENNYKEAVSYLEKFSNQNSQFTELANLLLILSYYNLNEFEKSKNLITKFEVHFPHSNSLQTVLETKLAIAIVQNDFDGIKSSLESLNKLELKKERLKNLKGAFKRILEFTNETQNSELNSILTNPLLRFSFLEATFQKVIEIKNTSQIKNIYRELVQLGIKNDLIITNKIGVLIPIESNSGTAEDLIIEGLKFGVHRFNDLHDKNIELKIFKGNQRLLEKALIQLAKDPEVLCVVGPLYSAQFKSLAALADKLCIPIISPTATASDISIKSNYIFQFNPTLDVRGDAMAIYAIDKLRLSKFALLSSDNVTIKTISKEIRDKIKSSKCDLIADINWNESKKTLSSKIKEIRKAGANRDLVIRFTPLLDFETEQKLISFGMTQTLIDSLKLNEAEVSIYEIFGKDAEKICKANKIDYYKRTKSIANDLNTPIYSIDALFIPISDNKLISDIVNEVENQNIITKIIGNDNWNSLEELNKAYPASNGVIFTSDFYFDLEDKLLNELTSEIFEYTSKQPNRTFFYGFETINKILENWNDYINRENFYEKLINDKDYKGISSDIILNKSGVNSSVYILEYRNRKIKKLDRVIAN